MHSKTARKPALKPSRRPSLKRRLAGVLAIGAVVASGALAAPPAYGLRSDINPPPAPAPPPGLTRDERISLAKQRAAEAIGRRQTQLDKLARALNDRRFVTADHRGALLGQIGSAKQALTNLGAAIESEPAPKLVHDLISHIVSDNRVYSLLTPKVRIVIAADAGTEAVGKLGSIGGRLDHVTGIFATAGRDVTEAAAGLASMHAHVGNAAGILSPIADSVIGLTAAGFPGNRAALVAAVNALKPVRNELHAAIGDTRGAVDVLLSLR